MAKDCLGAHGNAVLSAQPLAKRDHTGQLRLGDRLGTSLERAFNGPPHGGEGHTDAAAVAIERMGGIGPLGERRAIGGDRMFPGQDAPVSGDDEMVMAQVQTVRLMRPRRPMDDDPLQSPSPQTQGRISGRP